MPKLEMQADPLARFSGKKYISLETYRRNGQGVRTPVWFIAEDGELFVRTDYDTGKVRRIRGNSKVRFAMCNLRGSVRGDWLDGTARFTDDETAARIRNKLKKKYTFMFRLTEFLGRGTTKAVVIQIRPSRAYPSD